MKRQHTKRVDDLLRKKIPYLLEEGRVLRKTWEEAGKLVSCSPELALECYRQYFPYWPVEIRLFPVGVHESAWGIPLDVLPTLTEKEAREYVWRTPYAGFVICTSKNGGLVAAKNTLRDKRWTGIRGIEDSDLTTAVNEGFLRAATVRDLKKELLAPKPTRFLESVTVSIDPQLVG